MCPALAACVFGAIDATSKLISSGDFDKFVADFKVSSSSWTLDLS